MLGRTHLAAKLTLLRSHTWLWRLFVVLALILSVSIAFAEPREHGAHLTCDVSVHVTAC